MSDPRIVIIPWFWGEATTLGMKNTIIAKRKPEPDTVAHESVHLAQARKYGTLGFLVRWVFSPSWRVRLEAEGYAQDVKLAPDYLKEWKLDWAAKCLSGNLYFHPCSYKEARVEIEKWL